MNLELIKQASVDAINASNPVNIIYGTVINTSPLKIQVSPLLILTEEFLTVDSTLIDDEQVILIKQQGGQKYLALSTIYKELTEGEVTDTGGLTAGTWKTVNASAYDDVGNLTANGDTLTWSSMTVAVPMGSVYKAHKNQYMQIQYPAGTGTIVTAKVTDCGNFGAGNKYTNRELDLAPGIWKGKYGFSSASAWGLRQVKYRYLT